MICRNCNANVSDNSIFCPVCGVNLSIYNQNQLNKESEEPVSFGTWLGISLIKFIPVVGILFYIILMLVWAFGSNEKKSLKNFAKAQLLLLLFVFVVLIIVFVSLLSANFFGGYRIYNNLF